LSLVSLILIWCETTFFSKTPVLSVIALWFQHENISYFWLELVSIAILAYMCSCCVFSLFRVKIFGMFSLNKRHTDVPSLAFIAAYMCRLTFPLCYNFMNIIQDDQTQFSEFMGQMDMNSVLDGFQLYVPILISVIIILNLFSIPSKIGKCCGVGDLFSEDYVDQHSNAEGKLLLQEARQNDISFGRQSPRGSTGLLEILSKSRTVEKTLEQQATMSDYKKNNPIYQKYVQKGIYRS
jgi:hypothetical protein